ncbi:MAG: hypothetical protein AAF125_14525, partial [Chloroflexota bacterium]
MFTPQRTAIALGLLALVMLAACRPSATAATLVPEVPTRAFVTETDQVYTFTTLATDTVLQLRAEPASLPYVAEVRDASGALAATLSGGGALQDASVTLPGNSGDYEVRVRTDSNKGGTVQLIVSSAVAEQRVNVAASPTKEETLTPNGTVHAGANAGVCQLRAVGDVSVHSGATLVSEALGGMRAGSVIGAEARA